MLPADMAKQQPDNIEKHSDNDNEETNAEERDVEKTVGESTGECNGDKSSSVDKTQMVCKSDKDLDHRGDDSSLTKPRECKVGCSASPTTPITSVTFPANVASVLKPPGDDASPLCDATLPPSLADNGISCFIVLAAASVVCLLFCLLVCLPVFVCFSFVTGQFNCWFCDSCALDLIHEVC